MLRAAFVVKKLIYKLSFHETLDATFMLLCSLLFAILLFPYLVKDLRKVNYLPTYLHNFPASRHLPPAYHSQSHPHVDSVLCSLASAQYCMFSRSSGDADNCPRHETCWRVHSNLMTYLPFVSLRTPIYVPGHRPYKVHSLHLQSNAPYQYMFIPQFVYIFSEFIDILRNDSKVTLS